MMFLTAHFLQPDLGGDICHIHGLRRRDIFWLGVPSASDKLAEFFTGSVVFFRWVIKANLRATFLPLRDVLKLSSLDVVHRRLVRPYARAVPFRSLVRLLFRGS